MNKENGPSFPEKAMNVVIAIGVVGIGLGVVGAPALLVPGMEVATVGFIGKALVQ